MNTITKKEHMEIQAVADEAIRLNARGLAENTEFVIDLLISRFGISKDRAESHAAKAARRKLRPAHGGARIAGPGKKLGRPKQEYEYEQQHTRIGRVSPEARREMEAVLSPAERWDILYREAKKRLGLD